MSMVDLYVKALPAEPKKRLVPRNTCADRKCRVLGQIVNWKHCPAWLPREGEKGQ